VRSRLTYTIGFIVLAAAGWWITLGQNQTEPVSISSPTPTISNTPSISPTRSNQQLTAITVSTVAQHNTADDCWLIIDRKVYDVTNFIGQHPGGNVILDACGTDATELFETRPMGSGTPHSEYARDLLNDYFVGDLETD